MENKCIKKSSLKQLQVLVEYMEANPEFARGSAVYGNNKLSMEEQWVKLTKKLNSHGPPMRSVVEWKKTWTDLKSRTKKKIAENKKSLCETGGGVYRMNSLSELEKIVDRTLFLSKAAAPSGKVFGLDIASPNKADSIQSCFSLLVDTPPRSSKSVAVVSPSSQQQPTQQSAVLSPSLQYKTQQKRHHEEEETDLPSCSSAKKKLVGQEQIGLIRRQLRVGEQSVAVAKQHSDAAVTLAEATKALADAAKRIADAVEIQAATAKTNAEIQAKILSSLNTITILLAEKNK